MKNYYYTAIKAMQDKNQFKQLEGIYSMSDEDLDCCIVNKKAIQLFKQDLVDGEDRTGVITFENGRIEIFSDTKDRCIYSFVELENTIFDYLKDNNLLFKNNVITFR